MINKRRYPFTPQSEPMDCGAACLSMICQYFGVYYSVNQIKKMLHITREGVSLKNLSDVGEQLGLRTKGCQIGISQLIENIPPPYIAHWNNNHFIVIYKISTKSKTKDIYKYKMLVADPAFGLREIFINEFLQHWVKYDGDCGVILTFEPSELFFRQRIDNSHEEKNFFSILNYLKPHRHYIVHFIGGFVVASGIQLIAPFLTQSVIDYGIVNQNINFVTLVLIAQLALFIGQTAIDFIQSWLVLYISTRVNIAMKTDFLIKLMKLPISFFDSKLIGDILQRIRDNSRIQTFLTHDILQVCFSFVSLLLLSVILAVYNISIFGMFWGFNILYVSWIRLFLKKRRNIDYGLFSLASREQSNLYETVVSMQEIKLQNCEKYKRSEWEEIQAKLFKLNMDGLAINQYQQAGSTFINQIKNILISFFAARSVIQGNMTLGMLVAIQYIIGQLNSPISMLFNFIHSIQDAKISKERVDEIKNMKDEDDMNRHRNMICIEHSPILVENVNFKYDDSGDIFILNNINLNIFNGKITAIVGESGSGKTTLIKLLLGFYEPTNGRIMIGNDDIRTINTHLWHSKCGAVLQDSYIFSDTIANNIAIGKNPIDQIRIRHAAEVANLREVIEMLPLGYDTKIGHEGKGLSQGQKQRILIARMVYKNPEYIFMDEATNSLDAKNESLVMKNMRSFFIGKTVIIAAHRLSTIKHADQIIVMKNGQIVEIGVHKELITTKKEYYTLIKKQLELSENEIN